MRHIVKGEEPSDLTCWKQQWLAVKGEPYIFDYFVGQARQKTKEALLQEQGFLCCYCMARIDMNTSHFEHFIPQTKQPDMPHDIIMDYHNLFLSCNGESGDGRHCGHRKDNTVLPPELSPEAPGIESHFSYSLDGYIVGKDSYGELAISTLKLNNYHLRQHRSMAIQTILAQIIGPEDPVNLIAMLDQRDPGGAFLPFCNAVIWALRQLCT